MKINRVTITGVDERTDLERLALLWRRFKFVEFGVLLSKSSAGNKPRYPSTEFMNWIVRMVPRDHLALHVCGEYSRVTFQGQNLLRKEFLLLGAFGRIQFNNVGETINPNEANSEICKLEQEETIFPLNKRSTENSLIMANRLDKSAALLHDSSGGRGVTALHNKPIPGFYNGYAGGLGPSNILAQLENINKVVGDSTIWIDMESKIRTDDWLDLDKVESVLKSVQASGYLDKDY